MNCFFFSLVYFTRKEMRVATPPDTIRPARTQQRALTQTFVFLFIVVFPFVLVFAYSVSIFN